MPHRPGSWHGISTSRRTKRLVFFFLIVTVVAVVAVVTPLVLKAHHLTLRNARIRNNEYPSRYTGFMRFTKFCHELTLQGQAESEENVEVTLYLLNSKLTQTKTEEISFNNTYSLDDNGYVSSSYYLLPNSTISLNACALSFSTQYYLLQGQRNFLQWEKKKRVDFSVAGTVASCDDSNNELLPLPSFKVKTEDLYYIVLAGVGLVNLKADIIQVLHDASGYTVNRQCSINSNFKDSCSLPVEISSGFSEALLELESKGISDLQQNSTKVIVECSPRDWLYAATGILAIVGVIGIALGVVGISLHAYEHGWCFRQRKRNSVTINSPILNDTDTSQGYQSL